MQIQVSEPHDGIVTVVLGGEISMTEINECCHRMASEAEMGKFSGMMVDVRGVSGTQSVFEVYCAVSRFEEMNKSRVKVAFVSGGWKNAFADFIGTTGEGKKGGTRLFSGAEEAVRWLAESRGRTAP